MKVLCLLVFLGLPLTSTAQQASQAGTPDLLIIAYKLGPIVRIDTSNSGAFAQLEGQTYLNEVNPPHYEWTVKASIKLRNTGARTIKSVSWELLLTEDSGRTRTIQELNMPFKKAIRPGATVKVSKWIRGYDLKAWSQRQKEGLLQVRANITRIKYIDGSVWKKSLLRLPLRN